MSAVELARATLQALLDAGVSEFVLSPGSRNTPLSLLLAAAERNDVLKLHVRIDERTAGFLALGLAKGSGRPTAVVTTSGTAVANLHPAIVEADLSHTPIAVISANRPLDVLGTGANQTIDQVGLFGSAVRSAVHLDDRAADSWNAELTDAVGNLHGSPDGPGPVQIDLGLAPPLVSADVLEPLDRPETGDRTESGEQLLELGLPPRTLVVVAECGIVLARSAVVSATVAGFPVHIEAGTALAAANDDCLRSGASLLSSRLIEAHRPEHLLIVGRPTLARPIPALAIADDVTTTVVHDQPGLTNALQTGNPAHTAGSLRITGQVDQNFAQAWRAADDAATAVVVAETARTFDAGAVAYLVAESRPDLLIVASSNSIRDLDQRAVRRSQRVLVNRGAAGIDGLVSTSIGAAIADQRNDPDRTASALLGDLAFLHDANGLLLAPSEVRPNLTFVVINNDGGAIFASLEQGGPQYAEEFERVFGTPHGADLRALCATTHTTYLRCDDRERLQGALQTEHHGIRVIEVPVTRRNERERRQVFSRRVIDAAEVTL